MVPYHSSGHLCKILLLIFNKFKIWSSLSCLCYVRYNGKCLLWNAGRPASAPVIVARCSCRDIATCLKLKLMQTPDMCSLSYSIYVWSSQCYTSRIWMPFEVWTVSNVVDDVMRCILHYMFLFCQVLVSAQNCVSVAPALHKSRCVEFANTCSFP